MTLTVSKSVSESVITADSAKSASIVTDSSGALWDLSNSSFFAVSQNSAGDTQLNLGSFTVPGVPFATGKAAWLATRS